MSEWQTFACPKYGPLVALCTVMSATDHDVPNVLSHPDTVTPVQPVLVRTRERQAAGRVATKDSSFLHDSAVS